MADLSTLKARIASEMHRSDLTTHIASAISTSISYYRSKRFEFNQTQATFPTIASQQDYDSTDPSFPDDIGQIDSVRITVSGNYTQLTPRQFTEIEGKTVSSTLTGRPSEYAWYGDQLWLYPIPDAVYSVRLSYKQRKDEPSSDSDSTTIWTNQCEALIRACAKKLLCRDVLRDPNGYQMNKDAELEAFAILMDESMQLQDEGGLQPNW